MQKPADPFERIDQDGSGSIDRAEMEAFSESIAEKTGEAPDVDEFFARFDADGDGQVSKSEAPQPGEEGGFRPPPGMGMGMPSGMPPMGAGPI